MFRRVAALFLTFLLVNALTACAEEKPAAGSLRVAVDRAAAEGKPALASWAVLTAPARPKTLTALYGTYAGLQALDIVSTRRAIAAGAREQNPLMGGGSMGTMIAVKTAAGASTIFFAERMWKKNRAGAIVVMAALNGASAAIVARNQHSARR